MPVTHTAATLLRAGVLTPGRPDRVARQLWALGRWGLSLAGGYTSAAGRVPDEPAVIDECGTVTFGELRDRTDRLAHGLVGFGVTAASTVGVLCRNHRGAVEAMVAAAKLGADTVLLNTGLSTEQTRSVLADQDVRVLIADQEFALPGGPMVITAHAETGVDGPTLDDLVDGCPARPVSPPKKAGRTIVLTSGTTARPKGAHRAPPKGLGPLASIVSRIPFRAGEPILVAAPLFHTWGFAGMQVAMGLRAPIVLHRRFEPSDALRAVAEHRCAGMVVVPVMAQRLLGRSSGVDLRPLRIVASSGSALVGDFAGAFMDEYGEVLYNLYGSTEVSWASIATPAELRRSPSTAGRPPAGTRLAILDPDGRPVPAGVTGAIHVANELLFEGYTTGGARDLTDGLLSTGDVGHLGTDGLLYVDGRADDMVISGGENLYPREVEDALSRMPSVVDVAVVGVPDVEWGHALAAYLVTSSALTAEQVRDFARAHLARYAVPRDVHFLDELPRNATGKVLKRDLPT